MPDCIFSKGWSFLEERRNEKSFILVFTDLFLEESLKVVTHGDCCAPFQDSDVDVGFSIDHRGDHILAALIGLNLFVHQLVCHHFNLRIFGPQVQRHHQLSLEAVGPNKENAILAIFLVDLNGLFNIDI